MRAAVLSVMMLTAMVASGAGIYAATASSPLQITDGYGISALGR